MTDTVRDHPPGPWKKGQSGNPAGKPKGAHNKVLSLRFLAHQLLACEMPYMQEQLRVLREGSGPMYDAASGLEVRPPRPPDPKAYCDMMVKLLDFGLPRLTRQEVVTPPDVPEADDLTENVSTEDAQRAYLSLVKS